MTITIGDKTYNVEDLDQEQQHIVGLIIAAQTELQHQERSVVLQHGLQNLQNQLLLAEGGGRNRCQRLVRLSIDPNLDVTKRITAIGMRQAEMASLFDTQQLSTMSTRRCLCQA